MAYAFDTLGCARTLREAGVPAEQAEAHADAARDFVMAELVTKEDLRLALDLQAHQILVRLGALIAASIAATGVIVKMLVV